MAASIGQCAEKQSPRGPDLQGKDLQAGSYPKHGSIQVETFPITLGDGSESVRGDNLPQVITPFSKKGLRTNGNGKSVSWYSYMKMCASCKLCISRSSAICVIAYFHTQIRPSSITQSGSDVLYTVSQCTMVSHAFTNRHCRKAALLQSEFIHLKMNKAEVWVAGKTP